jgi:hypothetical protein
MGISETLGGIYSKAEDAFFGILDSLQDKGVPVYSVVDPLEKKGVPVFPAALAVSVVLVFLVAMLLSTGGSAVVVAEFKDQKGNLVNGVSLSVYTENDDLVLTKELNSGESFTVEGIPLGTSLYGRARKTGYADAEIQIVVRSREGNLIRVLLQKDEKIISAVIKLSDVVTGTGVRNAGVKVIFRDGSEAPCFATDEGFFECGGLTEGEETLVKIESSNYETEEITKAFTEGSSTEVALTPTSASFTGSSGVVVKAFDSDSREVLEGVKVEIYKGGETEPVTSVIAPEGEYIESIPKGNIVRVVVSKSGYVSYDSIEEGLRTLRESEEKFEAYLKKGAASVEIFVSDQTGAPLSGVKVSLFDSSANIIASEETGFGGNISFDDVNGERLYYLTAYREGFLPKRTEVRPNQSAEYRLELIPKTASNSAVAEVIVVQADGRPANAAALNFYEVVEEEMLPLGLPQAEADLQGRYLAYSPLGIIMAVEAVKEPEAGSTEAEIKTGRNELFIYMAVAQGMVKINLVDEQDRAVKKGRLRVETGSGDVLFDEDLNETIAVWVNKAGNKNLRLHYETADGKIYDEEINVEGKSSVEVKVTPREPESMAPDLEFLGIFTPAGKKVEAVTKGKDYYAKFSIELPQGNYGSGIHVRVGRDSVSDADSDDAGITGYSAVGVTETFYGRTYSPEPAPGFEGADRQNKGKAGSYNKWLELKFRGSGTKIIKVRVKAKESAEENSFDISYRAWLEAGGNFYRVPEDKVIGNEAYSAERMGLYAETKGETIRIFSSAFTCESDICASYRFVSENGSVSSPEEFSATKGMKYALEAELVAMKDVIAELKAATDPENPKIYFIGTGVNSARFPEAGKTDTSAEIKKLPLKIDEKATARIYFSAAEEGPSSVSLTFATADDVISEEFPFNVTPVKDLSVTFEPSEIRLGEDFRAVIKDSEGRGIENASVRLIDKEGKIVKSAIGRLRTGKGGIYKIENNLSPGRYKVEIRAEGFRPYVSEINVMKTGVLFVEDTIKISIPKERKSIELKIKIENKGNERIENITYEIEKDPDFPQGMDTIISMPSFLEKNASQFAMITAEYRGEEERSHGEATLRISGTVLQEYDVVAESRVIVDYNPKYEGCLELSKERLVAYLASNAASSKTLKMSVKNNCEGLLLITPRAVALDGTEENIKITANPVELKPYGGEGSEKEITVNILNELQRNYPERRVFRYELRMESDSITESVPLDVIIWNPRTTLSLNRNLEVWLAATETGTAKMRIPLFARNVGEADIENLTFNISARRSRGYVSIKVLPTATVARLPRGAAMIPPLEIEVESGPISKGILHDVREIDIIGTIDGQRYEFGPVIINSHVSPPQCLKVSPENTIFRDTQTEGALSKTLTVTNNCSEELLIRAVEPSIFGSNYFDLSPQGLTLRPAETEEIQLILRKREAWTATAPLFIKGFLVRSQKWVTSGAIRTEILLGEIARSGEASIAQRIPVCTAEGEPESREIADVRLPKIALSDECGRSYCDAEQIAQFIAERMKKSLNEAQNRILQNKESIANTGCTPEKHPTYCPFELLGVSEEEYDVYMLNDNLAPEMLEDIIEKSVPSIKHFAVDYAVEGSEPEQLLGALGNKIYLDRQLSGCGKYTLQIKGAVRVSGTAILKDYMGIVVSVRKGGNETQEQCLPRISNAMNFLPWDRSYTPRNSRSSWLSITQAMAEEDKELAEKVAQQMFASKERFIEGISGYRNNSRLVVRSGATEGHVVKLSMEKTVDGPATVYADVLQTGEATRKNITEEAAKAIAAFKEGIIDGCISPDEDYILLKSAKGIGRLVIDGEDTIKVKYKQPSCADLSVEAETADTIDLTQESVGTLNGIKEVWFEKDGERISTVVLQKDEEKKKYYAQFRLCAEGLNNLQNANKQVIKVYAASKLNPEKRIRVPKEIRLEVCGIHPYELIAKLSEKEDGTYYATPMWKGAPESLTVADYKRASDSFDQLNYADALLATGQAGEEPSTGFNAIEAEAKRSALFAYVATCAGVNLLMSALYLIAGPVGWTKAFVDMSVDCIVPFGWEFMDTFEGGLTIKETMANVVSNIPFIGGILSDWITPEELERAGEERVPEVSELVAPALTSVITRAGVYSIAAAGDYSARAGELAARKVAETIAREIKEKAGTAAANFVMPQTGGRSLEVALENEINNKLKAAMKNATKEQLRNWDNALMAATEGGIGAVAGDKTFTNAFMEYLLNTSQGADIAKSLAKEGIGEYAAKAGLRELAGEGMRFDRVANVNIIKDVIRTRFKTKLINSYGSDVGISLFNRIDNSLTNLLGNIIKKESIETVKEVISVPTGPQVRVVEKRVSKEMLSEIAESAERILYEEVEKLATGSTAGLTPALQEVSKELRTPEGKAGFENMAREAAGKAAEREAGITKWEKFKNFFKSMGTRSFWKTLGMELGKGVVSNAIGMLAYNERYKKLTGRKPGEGALNITGTMPQQVDSDADGVPDMFTTVISPLQELNKGHLYAAIIKTTGLTKTVKFISSKALPEDVEDTAILDDCDPETFDEGVEAMLPSLIPKVDAVPRGISPATHARHVKAYLQKSEGGRYGALIASAVKGTNVPEALLVTVGIWKTDLGAENPYHITGCEFENPKKAGPMESFRCAAEALDGILTNTCKQNDEKEHIVCVLEAYNKEPNYVSEGTGGRYYGALYEIYRTWNNYRSFSAS